MKKILSRQMLPFFKMVKKILENIDEEFLQKKINKYQCWKMIYHPLYWMDYHISGKNNFIAPLFHIENLHKLDIISEINLSKKELNDYCDDVEKRFLDFIERINLAQDNSTSTDLDLYLGQMRHLFFHVGMLYTVILYEKNIMLETLHPEIKK